MTVQYNINNQIKGVNGFGLQFSENVYTTTLAASTAASLTVPSVGTLGMLTSNAVSKNQFVAVMTYTAGRDVWVSDGHTAAVPAGDTFAVATSELNPPAKVVNAGDVLSFICATASTNVCVAFYSIQQG